MAKLFKKQWKQDKTSEKNWYQDRFQSIAVQRNILALVTLVCLVLALVATFAVYRLTPLKSVQPFVIQIDDKTGRTQVVEPVKELTGQASLVRYFAHTYIRAREEYAPLSYQQNYETVRLMSSASVFSRYQSYLASENPSSPLNVYGTDGRREVILRSLVLLNDNMAQARITIKNYHKYKKMPDKNYVVWIGFEFKELDLTAQERYINPLGFRVTDYRVEEEFDE